MTSKDVWELVFTHFLKINTVNYAIQEADRVMVEWRKRFGV